jgi:hypothetical protein
MSSPTTRPYFRKTISGLSFGTTGRLGSPGKLRIGPRRLSDSRIRTTGLRRLPRMQIRGSLHAVSMHKLCPSANPIASRILRTVILFAAVALQLLSTGSVAQSKVPVVFGLQLRSVAANAVASAVCTQVRHPRKSAVASRAARTVRARKQRPSHLAPLPASEVGPRALPWLPADLVGDPCRASGSSP